MGVEELSKKEKEIEKERKGSNKREVMSVKAYLKKQVKSQINNLAFHIKNLEQGPCQGYSHGSNVFHIQ